MAKRVTTRIVTNTALMMLVNQRDDTFRIIASGRIVKMDTKMIETDLCDNRAFTRNGECTQTECVRTLKRLALP